jgi:hypothetical protein
MNPSQPPFPGGAAYNGLGQLWHPPIASKWIFTALIVFAGAVANRIPIEIRKLYTHPLGFFLTALVAISIYQMGFPPATFAILFFLLSVWVVDISSKAEGYLNAAETVDWVSNSNRWYVEKVLKERPMGIQEKDVSTYPVSGLSAQGNTSNGNT